LIETLLQGVLALEESVTYQKIIRKGKAEGRVEGKVEEARKILLMMGRNRFGEPSAEVTARLDAVTDLNRLEALIVRLYQATSWQELLGGDG
jgi:predicted transposase YdaD